jgi:hypothetical protein
MKNFMAVAFFVSAVVTGFSAAQAMPVAPLHQDPGGSIIPVYGGCGLWRPSRPLWRLPPAL